MRYDVTLLLGAECVSLGVIRQHNRVDHTIVQRVIALSQSLCRGSTEAGPLPTERMHFLNLYAVNEKKLLPLNALAACPT